MKKEAIKKEDQIIELKENQIEIIGMLEIIMSKIDLMEIDVSSCDVEVHSLGEKINELQEGIEKVKVRN